MASGHRRTFPGQGEILFPAHAMRSPESFPELPGAGGVAPGRDCWTAKLWPGSIVANWIKRRE